MTPPRALTIPPTCECCGTCRLWSADHGAFLCAAQQSNRYGEETPTFAACGEYRPEKDTIR